MTNTGMTAAELCDARDTLGLTDDKLAASLGLPPNVVAAWTAGRDTVPPHIARDVRWRAALAHRDRMVAESGLAACEWVTAWEARAPQKMKARVAWLQELNGHAADCPTCLARQAFVESQCPPLPDQPLPLWMAALRRLGALAERLPVWAQPAVHLGATFGLYSLFRMVFFLPRIVAHPRDGLVALAGLLLSISIGAALGAIYGGSRRLWAQLQARRIA